MIEDEYFPWKYENAKSDYLRTRKAIEAIAKVIEEEGLEDEELIVVSHGTTLRNITCEKFNDDYEGIDAYWFQNCELKSHTISL